MEQNPGTPGQLQAPPGGVSGALSYGWAQFEVLRTAAQSAAPPGTPEYRTVSFAAALAADARDTLGSAPSAPPLSDAPPALDAGTSLAALAGKAAELAGLLSSAADHASPADRSALSKAGSLAARISAMLAGCGHQG